MKNNVSELIINNSKLLCKELSLTYQKVEFVKKKQFKVYFLCAKGHPSNSTYKTLQAKRKGPFCSTCSPRKKTQEEVAAIFAAKGYILVSTYKAFQEKVHTLCPHQHDYYVTLRHFQDGSACIVCSGLNKDVAKEKALAAFKKEGYKVLGEYINARTPIKLLHEDHECEISWAKWNIQNVRCPACYGTPKRKLEDLQKIALEAGFTLFDQEYVNKEQKLKWQCHKRNHVFYQAWNYFRDNKSCPKCKTSAPEVQIMDICDEFEFEYIHRCRKAIKNYEIDVYLPEKKIGIEYCGLYWHSQEHKSKNYHFEKWQACHQAGIRLITIFEDEWLFGDGEEKLRKILSGKEVESGSTVSLNWGNLVQEELLELVPPKRHFIKNQKRCQEKTDAWFYDCGHAVIKDLLSRFHELLPGGIAERDGEKLILRNSGISLTLSIQDFLEERPQDTDFVFRPDEVSKKKDIVLSVVKNRLQLNNRKLFSRKLKLGTVPTHNSRIFFSENHLMGYTSAKSIGLFFEGELVCCLSYKEQKKGTGVYEVMRFANAKETTVVGGLSKLISFLKKSSSVNTLISYVDLRYSTGSGFEKLGFKKVGTSQGWKWTDGVNTFNRLKCRANMDERKLPQKAHAEELGWWKIYDRGQAKFILNP